MPFTQIILIATDPPGKNTVRKRSTFTGNGSRRDHANKRHTTHQYAAKKMGNDVRCWLDDFRFVMEAPPVNKQADRHGGRNKNP